jgi:hypothetical protein
MDESPKQLIGEKKIPIAAKPGFTKKIDYEYERKGVCNIFMAFEPLVGRRIVHITQRKTKLDWARYLKELSDNYYKWESIFGIIF